MFGKDKKGQGSTSYIVTVLGGIFLLMALAIIITAVLNYSHNSNAASSVSSAVTSVLNITGAILSPIFTGLLNLNGTNDFLKIISFILITIIIVGTMDTVSLFGEASQGALLNFFVGLIVAIIGVRYVPNDLWSSLTAPSSALVITVLLAIPFGAFFVLTMRIKQHWVSKLLWLCFLVFTIFLVYEYASGAFLWVYIVFLILAAIMLFFDATVRRFFRKEQEERALEGELSELDVQKRRKIREDIEKWSAVLNDTNASPADKQTANKKLSNLKKLYGQNLADI